MCLCAPPPSTPPPPPPPPPTHTHFLAPSYATGDYYIMKLWSNYTYICAILFIIILIYFYPLTTIRAKRPDIKGDSGVVLFWAETTWIQSTSGAYPLYWWHCLYSLIVVPNR